MFKRPTNQVLSDSFLPMGIRVGYNIVLVYPDKKLCGMPDKKLEIPKMYNSIYLSIFLTSQLTIDQFSFLSIHPMINQKLKSSASFDFIIK